MTPSENGFFAELKRRNMFRVAAGYVVVAWLVLQVGDVLFPAFGLADTSIRYLFGVLFVGFPIVLGFAWLFEITPEGLKREKDIDRSASITYDRGRRLEKVTIGVLAVAVAFFVVDKFVWSASADAGEGAAARSIAVLPFADMSEAGDQEWFSDGVSEELLNLLAGIPELRVIARNSSFQFKGQNLDDRSIAETLGVSHIVAGSVRRAGDELRIIATLVNGADGSEMWSNRYDGRADEVFRLQDQIATDVVEGLRVTLLGEALDRQTPASTEAHDLFLQGQHFADRRSPGDLARAVDHLEGSLALDSTYARAWSKLATVYGNMRFSGVLPPDSADALSAFAIARALELDPDDPQTRSRKAIRLGMADWRWAESQAEFARVLATAPRDPVVNNNASMVQLSLGNLEEAIRLASVAAETDPLNPIVRGNLAFAHYQAGNLDQAEAAWRRMLELGPGNIFTRYRLSHVRLAAGDPDGALEEIRSHESERWGVAALPLIYHALGRADESDAALADLVDRFAGTNAVAIAEAHAYRGEIDEAFEWLDRGYDQRDALLYWVKRNPLLANLEGDPRYRTFLEKMGLPAD